MGNALSLVSSAIFASIGLHTVTGTQELGKTFLGGENKTKNRLRGDGETGEELRSGEQGPTLFLRRGISRRDEGRMAGETERDPSSVHTVVRELRVVRVSGARPSLGTGGSGSGDWREVPKEDVSLGNGER